MSDSKDEESEPVLGPIPETIEGKRIEIESYVSHQDAKGYVKLAWGNESGKLTPEEARLHAFKVMEAAEAADTDAFMMEWLVSNLGIDFMKGLLVLREFRKFREAKYPIEE